MNDVAAPATGIKAKPAGVKARIDWLDAARGVGILLVIVGHALGGIIDSPLGSDLTSFRYAFFVIYSFHMPLFFILAGLLVSHRLANNPRGFAESLLIDLVWPYFLWSVIQFTVISMLGSLVNRPLGQSWHVILTLPWHVMGQFWFLYALFLLHGFALLALRRIGPNAFLLVCLSLKPLALLVPLPEVLKIAANHAPWYGIGVFLAAPGLAALVVKRSTLVRAVLLPVTAAVLLAAALAAAATFDPGIAIATAPAPKIASLAWNVAVFPAAICGSLAVVGLASLFPGGLIHMFAYLGRRTMPIFILHIMGIAGTRILLVTILKVDDPTIVLFAAISVGLVGPLIAFAIVARFGWSRALGLGRP